METSTKVENIFKAYTECAVELVNIAKDSKAYNYTYTSLEKLIEHSKPILHKHGLAIIQLPTGKGIITRMVHASGEWFEIETHSDIIQLKGMNAYQVQGSQITYLRRYAWASICGIASDEDMDANGEEVARTSVQSVRIVNDEQLKLLNTLLSKKKDALEAQGFTLEALHKHYKIDSFTKLPVSAFDGLISWLVGL